jgi:putative SOS response-associated peptidase YedK
MCGRFVSPEEAAIERYWHIGRHNNDPFKRRFNVCPTDTIPFLRLSSDSEELELATGRWGLVPRWWEEAKLPTMTHNARLGEATRKPMWRRARCLVPAEGWYEWQRAERTDPATGKIKPAKQPHFIRRADGRLFCFAGLMSYWKNPLTDEAIRSCAIVTALAAGSLAQIHERAPVVLPESAHAAWLDRKLTDSAKVKVIAQARVPPAEFTHYKVRFLVNNTKADGPELTEPADAPESS